MDEDLTIEVFNELFPQFSGISSASLPFLNEYLSIANQCIVYAKFGKRTRLARGYYVAHYLSLMLDMLINAENSPEIGGGTQTLEDKISSEKVGDVETKYHKPTSLLAGLSNENNDANTTDLNRTTYGVSYLAMLRLTGCLISTTSYRFVRCP